MLSSCSPCSLCYGVFVGFPFSNWWMKKKSVALLANPSYWCTNCLKEKSLRLAQHQWYNQNVVVISNYYNYLQGPFSRALKSKAIISCNIKGFRGAFICSPQRHMKKMWGKISKNINWVKNGWKFKFCKDFLFRYKPCSHPLNESGKCLLHYGI